MCTYTRPTRTQKNPFRCSCNGPAGDLRNTQPYPRLAAPELASYVNASRRSRRESAFPRKIHEAWRILDAIESQVISDRYFSRFELLDHSRERRCLERLTRDATIICSKRSRIRCPRDDSRTVTEEAEWPRRFSTSATRVDLVVELAHR